MPCGLFHHGKCMLSFVSHPGMCLLIYADRSRGWQVYFSTIGTQKPCYTMPSQTFVPAMSATISGITVITEHIFTRKYELTTSGKLGGLATGAKTGIAIGVCAVALVLTGVVLFLLQRRRARQTTVTSRNNNMIERSFSLTFPPGPQELASPEGVGHSPGSARSDWPMSSGSPPAYNLSIPRAVSGKIQSPQELPGSTFIHEHHPAYIGSEEAQQPFTAPNSPPGSPPRKSTTSPVVSTLGSPHAA
jgi:hypothetical protein